MKISFTCKKCRDLSIKLLRYEFSDPLVYTMTVVDLASHVAENLHLVYLYIWQRGEISFSKVILAPERMN